MPLKSNLKELASYKASAPQENRAMIEHLIELYSNKKIPKYRRGVRQQRHAATTNTNELVTSFCQIFDLQKELFSLPV